MQTNKISRKVIGTNFGIEIYAIGEKKKARN